VKPRSPKGAGGPNRPSAEPGSISVLQLAAEVRRRFRAPPGGGRATDPAWTAKRLIPMRRSTLARLQELATKVSSHVDGRVEPLQLAALLIEYHLPPAGLLVRTRTSTRDLGKLGPWQAWQPGFDEAPRTRPRAGSRRRGEPSLDRVRDLVGSVGGPPDLSTRSLEGYGLSTRAKAPREGRQSRQRRLPAPPFPDRSESRRSLPLAKTRLTSTVVKGSKGRI